MVKPGMFISDRYEIIDKVGSGGMADVYKAKDQRLNRYVAIKVLKPEYSSDKSFVNKFRGEAQSAAGLSHPNIVNVYDVGDDSGLYYIVMELVEGITLKRFIERKGKLEIKEAIGIGIQIAQGMEAAHSNHIIHRDIKPQNIIISRDGKVKVTDFGIAKATTSNTITSNAMGSVHYLSPEQARGGYSDEKSDIYSLGVTIYEMLSGKVPFAAENTVSVALLHIKAEATPLREIDPNIPLSVDRIVQKCMQKKAERRYHSASELIVDLKKAISNPDGDFVQIPAFLNTDSPTINISDDLNKIIHQNLDDEEEDDDDDIIVGYGTDGTGKIVEDEDDLGPTDSKVEKVLVIGSIVAVIIIAIAIIFLVIKFIIPSGKETEEDLPTPTPIVTVEPTPEVTETPTPTISDANMTFVVPRVVSLTETDAKNEINARVAAVDSTRVAYIHVKEDYSDIYEKDIIISQYPAENTEVSIGTQIVITKSIGSEPFALPDMFNLKEDQAYKRLVTDLGLKVTHDYISSSEVEEGRVISTDPPKDTMVKKGDTIIVSISTGPDQVVVPNLINQTEAAAKKLITDAGLNVGSVSTAPSDDYQAGYVTYQSTTAGQKVNLGAIIDIMVSTGPAEVPTTTPEVSVSYRGTTTIDINPFDYIDTDEARIELEMIQDGLNTVVYDEMHTSGDFPLYVPGIEGDSLNDGIVTMYVDGIPFKTSIDGVTSTWIVKFSEVEE